MIFQQLPLDFDVFQSTLAALTVLVSVTVFTTGFLSVGIHGERSRALDRVYLSENHLAGRIGTDTAISDRELNASYEALDSVRSTVARIVAYGNLLVFAAVAGLVTEWIRSAGWTWTSPIEARPSLWALWAILAIELAVVALGVFDVEHVAHDLKKRTLKTYGYRLSQIIVDLEHDAVYAEGRAKRLSQEVPNAPAIHRALGRVQLVEEEWLEALASFEKALASTEKIPGSRDLVAVMGKARALEALGRGKEAAAALTVFWYMTEDDEGQEGSVVHPVKWQTWLDAVEIVARDVPNRTDYAMVWLLDHYRDNADAMSATASALPRIVQAFDGHPVTARLALQRWSTRGRSDELTRAASELL